MFLVIDNYDSFTYNLIQQIGKMGHAVQAVENDRVDFQHLERMAEAGELRGIVISPGPGTPERAGSSVEAISTFQGRIPLLGICLGHQCVAYAYGGQIERADRLMHGKTSSIRHSREGLFRGLDSPLEVMRYHSLQVNPDTLPAVLEVTARTEAGEIMAVAHREKPIFGLQFHPESVLTRSGDRIVENFLELASTLRPSAPQAGAAAEGCNS